MSDQSPEQPQPKKKKKWRRTIAGLALLLLVAWCASYQSEKPVSEAEKSTQKGKERTATNTTASSEKPVNEAEKSTQKGQEDTAANTTAPVPRPDQASPQPAKNDVETRMCRVFDRDYYHETGKVLSRQNSLSASEQAQVDDKLTAEEYFEARQGNPSFLGPMYLIGQMKPVLSGRKLSLSERLTNCGLHAYEADHRVRAFRLRSTAPTMQKQQRFLVGIEFLKWLAMIVLSCSRAVRDLLASKRECCDIGGLHW
jgi:hypothetical protein